MKELFGKVREKLTGWWERTEKKDRARFFLITGVCLVVIIVAVVMLSRTQYAVLVRDMDPGEAGEVMTLLESLGVKVKTEGSGTILVPEDQVDRLRMDLAAQGYPKSGYTYATLAKGAGFGATDAEKRIYERLDLQERLSTTLCRFAPDIVLDARVEIAEQNMSTAILRNDVMPTTASVVLTLASNLSDDQIAAVENLVAASVPGLKPENVYITDQTLRRLNHVPLTNLAGVSTDYEKTAAVRDDLVRSVQQLLIPIFGADNVKVSGRVVLDFDERSTESVTFSPVVDDQGIDISLRTITEKARGSTDAGNVGIDANGAAPIYPETTGGLSDYTNITQEINREVNETRENVTQARGKITDLSFAIAVNSDNLSAENSSAGAVRNLVAAAVGLSPDEYDRISVEFTKFDGVAAPQAMQQAAADARGAEQWINLAKTLGLYLLIAVCVLLIAGRFFKLFAKKPEKDEELEAAAMDVLDKAETEDVEDDAEYGNLVKLATEPGGEEITVTKSDSRQRVEDFIDKNPDAVANLLRNWLSEETAKARKR